MTHDLHAMDEDWELLKSFLPENWGGLATEHEALKGLRKNKSAEALLRTLLIHVGCGYSLRETVVRAKRANLADLSDVALLKRLRKSSRWLYELCRRLFEEKITGPNMPNLVPMCLVDASIVSEPGASGSQWRIHYSLRWPELTCDFFKLTSVKGRGTGETLVHFPVKPGCHYLADRGYSTALGIHHVVKSGGYLAVRLNPNSVRLTEESGRDFPLIEKLNQVKEIAQAAEWKLTLSGSTGKVAVPGRLCVLRKSEEATHRAQEKLRQNSHRNKTSLQPETLEYAKFVLVFTTFDEKQFPTESVLEWYRLRWQIELVFKRFKQIAELGHLPKHDEESAQAWLYGKLLVALLTEKVMAYALAISPWGYDMGKIAHAKPLA